ncbi:MAG: peptidoglycan bridge formation glycyltransferase FemA/FemB family protein [bacterium]|nr:peptidoglycan bridge formation glycyltransferase FemA/FemB family protein [bacterium]
MFEIKEINNKEIWENFLDNLDFYPLFQAWDWGEVEKKIGRPLIRIGLFEASKLVGVCSIIEVIAKRGHYFHLRHGPVFLKFNKIYFNQIMNWIKNIAKKKGVSFIRLSPLVLKEETDEKFFKSEGFISSPMHNMDAETCWILDITKPEEQLLRDMRKTHRYLIRKAQSLNIKIIRTQKLSEIKNFMDLYQDLSDRKKFVPHKDISDEFNIFAENNEALLLFARYQNRLISGAFIVFAGKMGIYHHGASLDEFKNIPSSYLLQWEAILEAKKRGKKIYNFWGVVPADKPNHPWKGITMFKTGFGGYRVEFMHAKDLPVSFSYWKTYLIESFFKRLKGY